MMGFVNVMLAGIVFVGLWKLGLLGTWIRGFFKLLNMIGTLLFDNGIKLAEGFIEWLFDDGLPKVGALLLSPIRWIKKLYEKWKYR